MLQAALALLLRWAAAGVLATAGLLALHLGLDLAREEREGMPLPVRAVLAVAVTSGALLATVLAAMVAVGGGP